MDKIIHELLDFKLDSVNKLCAKDAKIHELKEIIQKQGHIIEQLKLASNQCNMCTAKQTGLKELIADALCCDGGHHKQWYLEEIAEYVNIDLSDICYDQGIAP